MLAIRGALLRLAALLGVHQEEQVEQVHQEEQGASELLVVALRFRNLNAVMYVKKSPKSPLKPPKLPKIATWQVY